ncbi:MAG: cupin domain-containing protein [Paludibacter sp.]|jgi:quercetin dioxygenase-like cupin family protein|nr:cupin domain-containing protein [Paludibacter sp.]
MKSKTFTSEKETAWQPAGERVTRQILSYNDDLMIVKVKFETGAIGAPHTHPHSQCTYVDSGRFEFFVGDEKQIVERGDGVYIAPNALHGVTCLEAGILIDTFNPARKDFL